MKEFLTHLGASVTFAAGIYSIFHYLDAVSSLKAKRAISDWFKAKYDSSVIANALVEVFDRLYTRPLLGWRALLRSALFTTVITGLVVLVFWSRIKIESELPFVFSLYLSNVISDYISLYLVRLWLGFTGHKPFVALLAGAIVGAAVVIPASATLSFLILYPVYGTRRPLRALAVASKGRDLRSTTKWRNPDCCVAGARVATAIWSGRRVYAGSEWT